MGADDGAVSSRPPSTPKLLEIRPEHLPPASPASCELAPKLPNSCPRVIGQLPQELSIGPYSARIGRFGPHKFADLGQIWPSYDQVRPCVLSSWANMCWPSLVKLGPTLAKIRQHWSNVWSGFAQIDQHVLHTGQIGQHWAQVGHNVLHSTASFGRFGAAFLLPGQLLGNLGSCRDRRGVTLPDVCRASRGQASGTRIVSSMIGLDTVIVALENVPPKADHRMTMGGTVTCAFVRIDGAVCSRLVPCRMGLAGDLA